MFINTAQKIFKNTGVQALGTIWNTLVGLLIAGLLSRYLGKAGYGEYSLVFIYLYFSTIIAYLGFDAILLREMSREKNEDNQNRLLTSALLLKLCFAVVAIGVTLLYLSFTHYSPTIKWAVVLVNLTLLIGAWESMEVVFKMRLKMQYSVISSVISQAIHLLFIYLAITKEMDLPYLISAYLIARTARVISIYAFSRKFIQFHFEWHWPSTLLIFKESLLLGLANGLWIIYYRVDNLMLDFMQGPGAVGQYNAAYKFVDMAFLLSGMLMNSIYPLMSSRYPGDIPGLKRIYQKSVNFISVIGGSLALLIILLSPYLITYIFGANFQESILTLRILGMVPLLIFLNNVVGHMLLVLGMQGKPLFTMRLFGVVINISVNLWLIPIYGCNGAALATVATEFILLLVAFVMIAKKIHYYPGIQIPLLTATGIFFSCVVTYYVSYPILDIGVGFLFFSLLLSAWIFRNWEEVREIFLKSEDT